MSKILKMLQFVLTIFLLLPSLNSVHGYLGNQCNIYDLRSKQCSEQEICDENTNSCQCAPGFRKVDNSCELDIKPDADVQPVSPSNTELDSNQKSSLLTGILMFIFVVVNIIVVIYVLKKYNVVYWVRNKVHSLRQSNYDEFMIGQDIDDDPPLR